MIITTTLNPLILGPSLPECRMGELVPSTIHCQLPRRSREENQANTSSSNDEDPTHADESPTESSQEQTSAEEGECSPPSRIQGALVYRNGRRVVDIDNAMPEGTVITFNCIASTAGERSTWKIICEKGEWIGRQMNCGEQSGYTHCQRKKLYSTPNFDYS